MKKQSGLKDKSVMSKEFDWFLFLLTIILAVCGIIFIYSATRSLNTNSNVIVQSGAAFLGIGAVVAINFFDYEQFKNLVKPIYIFSAAILILVLLFGTSGDWGARSWIRFGSIGVQPAELAKICFILTFSYHLEKVKEKINRPLILLGLILHISVPVGLILMQPDMGSAMVFMFMFACMIFMAGLSYKYIIPILGAGVLSTPLIYKYVLSEYQQKRIQVFLNPDLDPLNRGYNVIQSKIAVGSGQLWGKGYLEGTQNQMGYLPTKSTDFIFSVISEEFGFIGSMIIVIMLFALIWHCFKIAKKADNAYGKYICTGVASMFLFHVFENVGMCIGLMPVTGIPLPFMSYGGTSLLTNMLAVGLVMSVAYHNRPRDTIEVY
ncbi:MAG: rod shape-determining protein RodA [Clostridiales bacterium]|nr:rod shape-determining protein RodA [Clostridiales bacterium]